jgi:hypothetical protein
VTVKIKDNIAKVRGKLGTGQNLVRAVSQALWKLQQAGIK